MMSPFMGDISIILITFLRNHCMQDLFVGEEGR